jgi:hypothetical protein
MISPDVMCQVVDVTGSYMSSFVIFVIAVLISAFSILLVWAPEK